MQMGIGIDLVYIPRLIEISKANPVMLMKVFSSEELTKNFNSLAGKWAAKEAFIKAIDVKWKWPLSHLEILNEPSGKPYISFNSQVGNVFERLDIAISISHDNEYATSVVLVIYK